MKKIFLLLSFIPVGLLAQSPNQNPTFVSKPMKHIPIPKEGYQSPVQVSQQPQAGTPIGHQSGKKMPAAGYGYGYTPSIVDTVGFTTYDLQTNGALAKRLQLYPGGQESYVWIYSPQPPDISFTSRYSGYNTTNGTSWTFPYTATFKQYEFDRSGWPNIGELTTEGSTYEMLTSHYAAAGSATYAGGIYWYKNTGLGTTDFTKTIDLSSNRDTTTGLLWPRMATSGDKIYMIGTYEDNRKISGVVNPIVYFCYNTTLKKFTRKNITLPGYDSTRYGNGEADEYSIDARGQYVAVLTGGQTSDLALWKSSDSGKTFVKTMIDTFTHAPYNYKTTSFTDTVQTDDGTGSVAIDANGVAHVSYSPMFITNGVQYEAGVDSGYSVFYDNSGIVYWNDKDQKKISIGGIIDYDNVGAAALYGQGSNLASYNTDPNIAGYGGHNFSCYSNIAVDASGDVFVVFSAPHPDDLNDEDWSYRHVYCSVYNAGSGTWLTQQDILQKWQHEDVFATVSRDINIKGGKNYLDFVYMQDDVPGILIPPSNGINQSQQVPTTDTMIYSEVLTSDLLAGKVGLVDYAGINQTVPNNLFNTGSIYPNPATNMLNLSLNLTSAATVSVSMYNMLGEEIQAQNYDMLPSGINKLQFTVNNLEPGVYLCNISAGGYKTTQRVVIER